MEYYISSQTDDQGNASFDVSDGTYKIRADYLGYQYWSDVVTIPDTFDTIIEIAHRDVSVIVSQTYDFANDPLEGVRVYLFKASGGYMNRYATTNASGAVSFNLPSNSYKVRADYMSEQYWSDSFVQADQTVDIAHGTAILHIASEGFDVEGAGVYLFTPAGRYLGKNQTTDNNGEAAFFIPAGEYKFRIDYGGVQHWTDIIVTAADNEIFIDVTLE